MSDSGNRSVTARDIIGSSVVSGNNNTVSTTTGDITLPPAESVDIQAQLAELRALLAGLNAPDRGKLDRALADADDEAAKPKPDKDEVGGAIERVVKYAKGASEFSDQAEKLVPRLAAIAAWAGANGSRILGQMGISV